MVKANLDPEHKNPSKDSKQSTGYYSIPPDQRSTWYNSVAAAYDRTRPRYPQDLIQQAIAQAHLKSGAKILEIGCGPGIATVEFAKAGFSMVSLEPSLTACQFAKENCTSYPSVEIINTTFEDWELGAARFPAILAATSWHWVDPQVGYPKAIAALEDLGYLILLWNNIPQPSYRVYQHLQPVYSSLVPALAKYEDHATQEKSIQELGQKVIDSGLFKNLVSTKLVCQATYTLDDYLALLSTLSPYIALEENLREHLFAGLREVLATNCSPEIQTTYQKFGSKTPCFQHGFGLRLIWLKSPRWAVVKRLLVGTLEPKSFLKAQRRVAKTL